MRLLIVGGVAGGMSAATRARRLDERAEIIVFEKGSHVSFANCGLPYFIGGTIADRRRLLVATPERLRGRFRLDVRIRHEVTGLDRDRKQVMARELDKGRAYTEPYDKLVLAPGAVPIRPPIPGIDDPAVYPLRDIEDMDRIDRAADEAGGGRAVVIGGGFIGLEVAENLIARGLQVALAEMLPQVMAALDPEMAAPVHLELRENGVELHLSNAATAIERSGDELNVLLRDGTALPCAFAVLGVGVRPNTPLAEEAGLEIGETGGIKVDAHLRTADPDIYAVGDAIEVTDYVTGRPVRMPLAGPANRQGRIAADNICGLDSTFRGVQGTAIVKVFELVVANTGTNEKTLRQLGIPHESIHIHPASHAGYYPGAELMMLKLVFSSEDGRVLGAQIVGTEGVDKRLDVLSTAIQARMSVFDLEETELGYAPPYGAAKDPVNMAGFVAANALRGHLEILHPDEIPEGAAIVDVRTAGEFRRGHVTGSINIPIDELRDRLDEVPRHNPLVLICHVGVRAYLACRILKQHGFDPVNVSGGYRTYRQYHPPGREED
jgi:NADPH-dependent 2,4-dienoyl-CoA reductase/sulfur reductase-like enzyme/rhodanese-related sulfurtransferase